MQVSLITGCPVALHCCKTHVKISRKIGNSTPCKIIPHKNIILKLCIRDYVGVLPAMQILVSIGAVGVSLHIGEILAFWLFWTVLSCCPYLVFSILCPGRTAGLIFTLYGSNDVFAHKDGPFGVRTMGDHIWGSMPPKTSKMGVNRQFQAKTSKNENRNISKTINRINTKFEDQAETRSVVTCLGPQIYIFFARCRTSYSRWIISCSHR